MSDLNSECSGSEKFSEHSVKVTPANVRDFFSNEHLHEYYDMFIMFDQDGEGSIGKQEFGAMMKTLGVSLSSEELSKRVAEVDIDGSGEIDFDEMLVMIYHFGLEVSPEAEIKEAFEHFDQNNVGFITKTELSKVLRDFGEKEINEDAANRMLKSSLGWGESENDSHEIPGVPCDEFFQLIEHNQDIAAGPRKNTMATLQTLEKQGALAAKAKKANSQDPKKMIQTKDAATALAQVEGS